MVETLCGLLTVGDAGILVGQVEIFGIRILNARHISRLPCEALERPLELCESRMPGCLAELFSRPLSLLLCKVLFEGEGLLEMKGLEILIPGVGLKAA